MTIDPTIIDLLAQPTTAAELRMAEARAAAVLGLAKKQGKEKKPDANLVSLVFPKR